MGQEGGGPGPGRWGSWARMMGAMDQEGRKTLDQRSGGPWTSMMGEPGSIRWGPWTRKASTLLPIMPSLPTEVKQVTAF